MTQENKFKQLLRKLNRQTTRVPGCAQIVLTAMSLSLENRIEILTFLLDWLVKYPELEFEKLTLSTWGNVPKLHVSYQCQDCQKETEKEVIPSGMSDTAFELDVSHEEKKHHLVCQSCYIDKYYEPDDYDREPSEYELDARKEIEDNKDVDDKPILPLIQPKKKS